MSSVEDQNALEAASQLPRDMMLLKMENESIMAVARKEPRNAAKLITELQALIDAYPAAADGAIYSKPVGTVTEVTCGGCGIKYEVSKVFPDTACPDCDSTKRGGCRPVKKMAEGLSIRAAESIRTIFGYTRLATTCEILPDDSARITGILVDYVAGNITSDERIVSRHYKAKGGRMVTTPEDRFLQVIVKAEKAKLRRDVILDSTPGIVKAMFRDACEQKMAALISPKVIEQKIKPAFLEYGITAKDLDALIGSPAKLGWNRTQQMDLRKMLTALRSGETTPRELMEGLRQPTPPPAPEGGGVTVEDLTTRQTAPPVDVQSTAVEPNTPETAAESPEQPTEPVSAMDLEIQYLEGIRLQSMIRPVNKIQEEVEADPDLPAEAVQRLVAACDERRKEIRQTRG
jgi:hypothetical protein